MAETAYKPQNDRQRNLLAQRGVWSCHLVGLWLTCDMVILRRFGLLNGVVALKCM